MAAFLETFERVETKYTLDADQTAFIQAGISAYMALDRYGESRITSLYYDTPDRAMIARSVEKPNYKEKLRLRRYSPPCPYDDSMHAVDFEWDEKHICYLESKVKYDGIVYKRRFAITEGAATDFVCGMPYDEAVALHPLHESDAAKLNEYRTRQIAREIRSMTRRWGGVVPSCDLTVLRQAWAPTVDDLNLRITFDREIAYADLVANDGMWHRLVEPGTSIMETKAVGAVPGWFAHLLTQCRAYPNSYTKYGRAYVDIMTRARKDKDHRAA